MESKEGILRRVFGYSSFRVGQEKLIDALLEGRDVLGIMPTGGGKSICFQIPALLLPGVTLVISPLISLMKDQVAALKEAGVPAAYYNSSLTESQQEAVRRNIRAGQYRIVYAAPERLSAPSFVELAREIRISMVIVDEAHCISQWGQDFRPSYLNIADFLWKLPVRPTVGAFTATATREVREDIERILALEEPVRVITGFDRPNLHFSVRAPQKKWEALYSFVRQHGDQAGIVYCTSRKNVESVCEKLQNAGISAARYHAGLSDAERQRNQDAFAMDEVDVMVATNAFGMGIDKSNVRYVVHYNMPTSLEGYYQEAGRAGRDGEPAECVLLYSRGDIVTARMLIGRGTPNEALSPDERENVRRSEERRLQKMIDYCESTRCRRQLILSYFGETYRGECRYCDNCATNGIAVKNVPDPYEEEETETAPVAWTKPQFWQVLTCIREAEAKTKVKQSGVMIARILDGSKDRRLKEKGLDRLPVYGALSKFNRNQLYGLFTLMADEGYLYPSKTTQPLCMTARGEELLRSVDDARKQAKKTAHRSSAVENALFETLRAVRLSLSKDRRIPAYSIFTDAALREMARKKPQDKSALLTVSGVGETKAKQYGRLFLTAIAAFEAGRNFSKENSDE